MRHKAIALLYVLLLIHTAPESAPQNFNVVTAGVSLTFSWDEPAGDNPIEYYVLACTVDGEEALRFPLQLVLEITIEELMPSTDYVCTIVAVNSGGAGPLSNAVTATTGSRLKKAKCVSIGCSLL